MQGNCAVAEIAINGLTTYINTDINPTQPIVEHIIDEAIIRNAASEKPVMQVNLLTVEDVAEIFGLSTDRIYTLIRENILPAIRLGRQVRLSREAIEEFIKEGGKQLSGGWRKD